MMRKLLIALVIFSILLFIIGFMLFSPMAHDGDTATIQSPDFYGLDTPLSTMTSDPYITELPED